MFVYTGYAAETATTPLAPYSFERRDPGPTEGMLDFCAEHGITADIELIRMDQINEAYARMLNSDVKYRFVIDMPTL